MNSSSKIIIFDIHVHFHINFNQFPVVLALCFFVVNISLYFVAIETSKVSACISAHMNKIHDIDWNYRTEKELTTCSHDATVNFWGVQMHREPQSTIKAGTHAIWRARNYVRSGS